MDVFGSDSSDSEDGVGTKNGADTASVKESGGGTSAGAAVIACIGPQQLLASRNAANGFLAFHNGVEMQQLLFVRNTCSAGCGPRQVLAACDRFCYGQHWMMHVGDVKGKILEDAIRAAYTRSGTGPFLLLELGTYCGYSALLIAACLSDLMDTCEKEGFKRPCALLSVDSNPECVRLGKQLVQFALPDDTSTSGLTIEFKLASPGKIGQAARDFVDGIKDGAGLDLCFIDHDKEKYLEDLFAVEPFLKRDATVVADNTGVFGDSVSKYLERVRDPCGPYSSSVQHSAPVEYSDGNEQDSIEVSIFGQF